MTFRDGFSGGHHHIRYIMSETRYSEQDIYEESNTIITTKKLLPYRVCLIMNVN